MGLVLIDYGIKQRHIHRIYAETLADNSGAVRLCEYLGMRKEAHLIHTRYFKSRYWDTLVFAILASEWKNSQ